MTPLGRPRTAPLARKALRDDVHDALVEMLYMAELPPETALSIDGLARDLGVSPTPVREALVQLEHTGLVTRAALKGYRVAPLLSPDQMGEIMDARSVIEVAGIATAAKDPTDFIVELRATFKKHAELVDELAKNPDTESPEFLATLRKSLEADWAFHQVIMSASKNRYLEQMLDRLGAHIHRFRQITSPIDAEDPALALGEHARILAALEAGDNLQAVSCMRNHLEAVTIRATSWH